ncbi:hypothetical protein Tco_0917029 [Tanacetum coccineum]
MGVVAKRRTKCPIRAWHRHDEDGGGGSTTAVKPKRTLGASENQTHAVGARTTAVGGGGEMETLVRMILGYVICGCWLEWVKVAADGVVAWCRGGG